MSRPLVPGPRSLGRWMIVLATVATLAGLGYAGGVVPGVPHGMGFGHHGGGSSVTAYLNLTIRTNPANGLDMLSPANFTVHANARTIVTIVNFDTGVNPTLMMWERVMGTTSGTETVAAGSTGVSATLAYISDQQISHTLTIGPFGWMLNGSMVNGSHMGGNRSMGGGMMGMAQPADPWLFSMMNGMMVNLPVPAAANGTTPSVVHAVFDLTGTGTYSWQCEAPCDPTSMVTVGYMRGTVTVV